MNTYNSAISGIRKNLSSGFSLIETIVVIAIIFILLSIAVPSYVNYKEKVKKEVCNFNCMHLERIYHTYLLIENKEHTAYVFDEFLQKYEGNICPSNGDIKYVYGRVRCILHSEEEANENDDGDGSIPFL